MTKEVRLAVWVIVLALAGAMGLVLREVVPAAKEALVPNAEKELAVAFYQAHHLNQDPASAWEMMDPLHQKAMGNDKKSYLFLQRKINRMPTPARLDIQEWRRPQQQAYTYLIEAKDTDPIVVVVCDCDGRLTVLDSYHWKGEALP